LDLAPVDCADPNCEFDHGYDGTITSDEISVQATGDLDGSEQIRKLVAFTKRLSAATANVG
jgi:hypothetical protein